MKIFHILTIFIVFGIAVVTMDYFQAKTHENIHKQIAIYNGCQDYEMQVSVWKDSSFLCTYRVPTTPEMDLMEYTLDSQNEIVSYNVNYLSISLIFCTLLIVLTIILKNEE
jgi:hypothetical protein